MTEKHYEHSLYFSGFNNEGKPLSDVLASMGDGELKNAVERCKFRSKKLMRAQISLNKLRKAHANLRHIVYTEAAQRIGFDYSHKEQILYPKSNKLNNLTEDLAKRFKSVLHNILYKEEDMQELMGSELLSKCIKRKWLVKLEINGERWLLLTDQGAIETAVGLKQAQADRDANRSWLSKKISYLLMFLGTWE